MMKKLSSISYFQSQMHLEKNTMKTLRKQMCNSYLKLTTPRNRKIWDDFKNDCSFSKKACHWLHGEHLCHLCPHCFLCEKKKKKNAGHFKEPQPCQKCKSSVQMHVTSRVDIVLQASTNEKSKILFDHTLNFFTYTEFLVSLIIKSRRNIRSNS